MTQLKELLAGFKPEQPQIVGNMVVIPLTCAELSFDGIAGAENVGLAGDTAYNSLHLKPIEQKLTIVPGGFTYLTKESAQDRAVPRVQVIDRSTEVQAYCVQSSQGGHMRESAEDQREMHLLPMAIRQHAFQQSLGDRSYNSLWGRLGAYNRASGVQGDYLISLFDQFAEQLDQFVAQFEPIHQQRGTIILINGRVVGVDIFPSFHSYLQIWQTLIRDCYGAEAIHQANDKQPQPIKPLAEVSSVDEILDAVQDQINAEKDWAFGITRQCLEQEIEESNIHTYQSQQAGKVNIRDVKSSELEGQIVTEDSGQAVYLSLFRHAVAETKVAAFSI